MANNTGTLIAGPIRPSSEDDIFPVAFSEEIRGGIHSVADLTARDAIVVSRRLEGMLCYSIEDNKYYKLEGGITNDDWVEFTTDISGLVPYTGANTSVNLGSQSLTTTGIIGGGFNSAFGETDHYIEVSSIETSDGSKVPYLQGNAYLTFADATLPYAVAFDVVVAKQNSILGIDPAIAFTAADIETIGGTVNYNLGTSELRINNNVTDGKIILRGDGADNVDVYVEEYGGTGGNLFVDGNVEINSTLTIATGSITDSTGAISFGDENLTTTGTLATGAITSGTILPSTTGTFNIGSTTKKFQDFYLNNKFYFSDANTYINASESGVMSFNATTRINLLQDIYISGGVGIGITNTVDNSLAIGGGTQAILLLNGSTAGGRINGRFDGTTKWNIDLLETVVNFYSATLDKNVLTLKDTGDSVFYKSIFANTGRVGIGYDGGTAMVAGLQMNHNDGILSMGTLGSGYAGFGDAVTAMQWNPKTASFRVGRCSNGTAWDTLGNYSFASGLDCVASGTHTFCGGSGSQATGNFSFAFGLSSLASGTYDTAIGNDAVASGGYSVALGWNVDATGSSSVSIGRSNVASATNAIALGYQATSAYTRSICINTGSSARATTTSDQIMLGATYVTINSNILDLPSAGGVYLGEPETDGTWKISRSGDDLIFSRRVSGSWVTKSTISA